MKARLGIAILVVCVQLVTSMPMNRTKRYAEKPDLSPINQWRRAVGRYMPKDINMPDLEWDENLVATAKDLPNDCNLIGPRSNYRMFMEGPDQNGAKLLELFYAVALAFDNLDNMKLTVDERKMMNKFKTDVMSQVNQINLQHLEALNPSQTKIGCAKSHCTGVIEAWIKEVLGDKLVGDTYSFDVMCVLGPSGTWPEDNLQKVGFASKKADIGKPTTGISVNTPHLPTAPNKGPAPGPAPPGPAAVPSPTTEASSASTLSIALVLVISMGFFLY